MTSKSLFGRIVTVATMVITGLIFLLILGSLVIHTGAIRLWQKSGSIQTDVLARDTTAVVFVDVIARDFPEMPRPSNGDTLLQIDGERATQRLWNRTFDRPMLVGQEIPILFASKGDTLLANAVTSKVPTRRLIIVSSMHAVRFLIVFAFFAVGFIGLLRQPYSGSVRTFALFSFAMGAMLLQVVQSIEGFKAQILVPINPFIIAGLGILSSLFSAFWLNLNLMFPKPTKIMRKTPWLAYLLCYGSLALIYVFTRIPGISNLFVTLFSVGLITAQMAAGFVLLAFHYGRAETDLVKRQTRLVLLGTGIGLAPFLILVLVLVFFGPNAVNSLPNDARIFIILLFTMFTLLIPYSFLVAFNRYGLFDVEAKLKRGTRYALTAGVLLTVLLVLVLVASNLMVKVLGVTSRTPVLILAVVLAASVAPVQKKMQEWLEFRIYPERRKLRSLVNDFLHRASSMPDRETLYRDLIRSLQDGLNVTEVIPIQVDSGFTTLEHVPVPFDPEGKLVSVLESRGLPLYVDEIDDGGSGTLRAEEHAWLEDHRIELILPLSNGRQLVGLLALGGKVDEEHFRTEEVQILGTLANQLSLVLENLILLEENFEKRRLEEQLDLARQIQQGFLPQRIPQTPGLEMAATSLFSLEVAGDYYDVIREKNRTVIAVGDVSGKGAGAALIMANLQASLRALVHVQTDLGGMVSGINDIICQNTPSESYITFFVGEYLSNGRMRYVNAGHNPPLLIRAKSAKVEELHSGGLILGMLPNRPYEVGTVSLRPGDILILFTDGVTEAMNDAEEEFGETRLVETVQKMASKQIEEIVAEVRKQVILFSGADAFADDFTLLIARAVPKKAVNSSSDGKRIKSAPKKRVQVKRRGK